MKSRVAFVWSLLIVSWCFSFPVSAHELRPAYLELRETAPNTFDVLWKVPALGESMRLALYVRWPEGRVNVSERRGGFSGGAHLERWRVRAPKGLSGEHIAIDGLASTMTDVLVRVERLDGNTQVTRLTPTSPSFVVEASPDKLQVARTYLVLGIEHILTGIDHLLFVLALLLITRGGWLLVKTVTAFTVSHSITLTAATLGFVHMPQKPVEAIIALSIVFVAMEIARKRVRYGVRDTRCGIRDEAPGSRISQAASRNSHPASRIPNPASCLLPRASLGLTVQKPWIVAFTFGLLHGLGFAGGLSEVGLPQGHIPLALLFFSAGVETGHLLFVAAVLTLMWLGGIALSKIRDTRSARRDLLPASPIAHLESHIPSPASRIPNRGFQTVPLESWIVLVSAYAIGSMAMFWVIQRVAAF